MSLKIFTRGQMKGKWLRKVDLHPCRPPAITKRVGAGSTWQCKCGAIWVVVIYPSGYGTTKRWTFKENS